MKEQSDFERFIEEEYPNYNTNPDKTGEVKK